MRAFVTGITGFAGSHLAEHLIAEGDEVLGLSKTGTDTENLTGILKEISLSRGDIRDVKALEKILTEGRPDVIYHLAGEASSGRSFKNPVEATEVNILGTLSLLEAARSLSSISRVLLVTSAEVYGVVRPEELPVTEEADLRPVHPYATSKVAVHFLGYQYVRAYQMPIVEARAFNHIGARQSVDFVVPDFAKQLAEIKSGGRETEVRIGDLSAERDFTDVRDVVRAYRLLVNRGRVGEVYHVCSGNAHSVQSILDSLRSIAAVNAKILVDRGKLRPVKIPMMVGSLAKIKNELAWHPAIPLRQSLENTFEYWLERVKAQDTTA